MFRVRPVVKQPKCAKPAFQSTFAQPLAHFFVTRNDVVSCIQTGNLFFLGQSFSTKAAKVVYDGNGFCPFPSGNAANGLKILLQWILQEYHVVFLHRKGALCNAGEVEQEACDFSLLIGTGQAYIHSSHTGHGIFVVLFCLESRCHPATVIA